MMLPFCLLLFLAAAHDVLGAPGGNVLVLGGRGGTPGETHLTVQRRGHPELPPPQGTRKKEYREIGRYPSQKQDYYNNFEDDYDYPSEEPSRQRLVSSGFNAPSDFKSNFGTFDDFFKGFGSNKGFAHFLKNVNSFQGSSGRFPNTEKEESAYEPDFYDFPQDDKPKFTRPEPVYIPQEENYHNENADFRYKEESLYPEFEPNSFGDFPQKENDFNEFSQRPTHSEFEEFQETLKQQIPEDYEEFEPSHQFSGGPPPPYHRPQKFQLDKPPSLHPHRENSGHEKPSQGEELVIFNPNDIKKNKPIIRPIKSKEPVFSKQNFRNPVRPLSPNIHDNHQLIRIPSMDDRFRPIIKDNPRRFTEFDNSQEIITAPPFPKQRFVNSQASQTFDVKLGAGFNTRDGEALDTKVFKSIQRFPKN